MTIATRDPLTLGLVADIGGTNARFALSAWTDARPRLSQMRTYRCADFPSAEAAATAYLAELDGDARPSRAILAVAAPVINGQASLTNAAWRISDQTFGEALALDHAGLINDYAALALAAPLLQPADTTSIGVAFDAAPKGSIAVMGPGTGFGAAALIRDGKRTAVLTGEGGHIGFAPLDDYETQILRWFAGRFERVSVERILCGSGLSHLHQALGDIEGQPAEPIGPERITSLARTGDPAALRTLDRFSAILASTAGDLALALGAAGGVLLGGGITIHLLEHLDHAAFRRRFEAKGRMSALMKMIPTLALNAPSEIALMGAAAALYAA